MLYLKEPALFYPRFEVVSCFCENRNRIILLQRQSHRSEGDKWGLPAGKVDLGETPRDAVVREVNEETGLSVVDEEIKFIRKVYVKYPDYDFIFYMFHATLARKEKIRLSKEEHKAFVWIKPHRATRLDLIQDLEHCITLVYQQGD